MQAFDSEGFIKRKVAELKKQVGDEKALVAVSGGVDSVTSAVLTFKAIGANLLCVILDDAFMREGEPQHIAQLVAKPPIELPIRILNVQKRFMRALKGLKDAEEKRKKFRQVFYKVLSETAQKEKCKLLIQGTIKADVEETAGGVKTQHNVLKQIGIDTVKDYGFKVVEPLTSLYKWQVRMVARSLGIPSEIAERQPFPGPGLSVRVVGEIKPDKLDAEKKATVVLEREFSQHKSSQYFAAILDNKTIPHSGSIHVQETVARLLNVPSRHVTAKVFEAKATGVKGGKRRYGNVLALAIKMMDGSVHQPPISLLAALQAPVTIQNPSITRVLYEVKAISPKQPYVAVLRAIKTHDFLTAEVAEIPWATLNETAQSILETCSNISAVYYDVTSKPPATIEME